MSDFSDIMADVVDVAKEVFSDLIQYAPVDAGGVVLSIMASTGPTRFMLDGVEFVNVSYQDRDFVIVATDLVVGGQSYLPNRGDRVTDKNGHVWEAMVPEGGRYLWEWADRFETRIRVHLKKVE
jgi:hypothetical protein